MVRLGTGPDGTPVYSLSLCSYITVRLSDGVRFLNLRGLLN